MTVKQLTCIACGRVYPPGSHDDVCENHPGLEGILRVDYDGTPLTEITPSHDTFRAFAPLLPLSAPSLDRMPTGWITQTPLIAAPRLAAELGLDLIAVKDEGRNPTGSLKDRSSTLAALLAVEQGKSDICCASTGNAATSIAGICANLGLTAHIFVPEATPAAKLDQLRMFGADVMLVRGSYDDAYYLSRDVAKEFDWYDRNCATNPYLVEGKKTCGLELAQQIADASVDWLTVAVGDGCTITAIEKGLAEMHALGRLPKVPRLLGVQPAGAAPIVTAFASHTDAITPIEAHSTADSITVGRPRNAVRALEAVRRTGGAMVSVTDDDILRWRKELADKSGVFAEAGAAAGIAGLAQAIESGVVRRGERVVHIATGAGLKDAGRIRLEATNMRVVDATMESVRATIAQRESDGSR